jgi:hypothetical protein
MPHHPQRNTPVYAGAFLIGFSTLAIEISFTRLLSVISYYHLAFFAVSTAMLGMTAGAVTVFRKENAFSPEKLWYETSRASLGFALSAVVSAFALCLTPVGLEQSLMKVVALLALTVFCALPFYFSGIIMTGLLTRATIPVSRIYAADLIGASFGCLFVLAGLNYFDAVSLVIFSGCFGIAACFLFSAGKGGYFLRPGLLLLVLLLFLSFANHLTKNGIRPLIVKGRIENPQNHLLEKWNSFSRVLVFQKKVDKPQLWGPSPLAPETPTEEYAMSIDGEAGTFLRKFNAPADIEHLKYDLTALAYYLRDSCRTCIIGVGGGKDVQTAISFGSRKITGIDINPVFIDLLQHRFAGFTGMAQHPEVSLKVDEARSYLSHATDKYDIIQMSLVDTWASTGAGAFSLSENNLYTVEAWKTFIARLDDRGLFTVSRWYDPVNLGETGRLLSLAVAALLEAGYKDPLHHLALVTIDNLATLILSKQAFPREDIAVLKQKVGELGFHFVFEPGTLPSNPELKDILSAGSVSELRQRARHYPLNYAPPTDENPYFFNMLKIGHIKMAKSQSGVLSGNLLATITLLILIICLTLVAICTIAVPLFRSSFSGRIPGWNRTAAYEALYFSLIGAGFMLVEIALVQRLSFFLGHPVYALGILLFSMILSAGTGSLLSSKIIVPRKNLLPVYPFIAVLLILAIGFLIPRITGGMMSYAIGEKIAVSILIVLPLGFCLGWFFPLGMQLVQVRNLPFRPWYWALNGIFGVLFSAIAVLVSIYAGISINFYAAALMYAGLILIIPLLQTDPGTGIYMSKDKSRAQKQTSE